MNGQLKQCFDYVTFGNLSPFSRAIVMRLFEISILGPRGGLSGDCARCNTLNQWVMMLSHDTIVEEDEDEAEDGRRRLRNHSFIRDRTRRESCMCATRDLYFPN